MTASITNRYGTVIRRGQVWVDCDPRQSGRRLRVVDVNTNYAYCETQVGGKPRRSRIMISRLHPTSNGYRLLEDPEAEA